MARGREHFSDQMTNRTTGAVTFKTPSGCHELNNWILIQLDHVLVLIVVFSLYTCVGRVFSVQVSSKCSSFGSVVKLPQGHHNFVVVFLHGWLGQKVGI